MPASKKTNFARGDSVDVKLDPILSTELAITTGANNDVADEFEIYLLAGENAPAYGPVALVDPKARTTPLLSLVGASKSGTVDCSGYSVVRIKRKAGVGAAGNSTAYWATTTF